MVSSPRRNLLSRIFTRNFPAVVIEGLLIGVVLAFVASQVLMSSYVTTVDGWSTIVGCGEPGNGLVFKAACANRFPAVNVPREALYWTTNNDGAGQVLSGQHDYTLRFPPGGLPPTSAFWSLTMGDAREKFVPNPINRYSVSDRSGLVPSAGGSIDIYIQNAAPPGHESNWLPAPSGKFVLWLRVYLPGQPILDGKYRVPPVVEVK